MPNLDQLKENVRLAYQAWVNADTVKWGTPEGLAYRSTFREYMSALKGNPAALAEYYAWLANAKST